MTAAHFAKPASERVLANIQLVPQSGCWLYMGPVNKSGHGVTSEKSRGKASSLYAHRVIWVHFNGPIPKGMSVLHHCDVPSCVNPYHLYCGDQKQNSKDAVDRGQYFWGEKVHTSKLKKEDVIEIMGLKKIGVRNVDIANMYGLNSSTVSALVNKKTWKKLHAIIDSGLI